MVTAEAKMEKPRGEDGYHCNAMLIRPLKRKIRRGTEPNTINDAAVTAPFIMEELCEKKRHKDEH